MPTLTQRFSTPKLYLDELERINKRWEPVRVSPNAYDVDTKDLPHGYSRRATEER